MKTTPLRPHKVLGTNTAEGDLHALTLLTGPFAGIIFSYTDVKFSEDEANDKLKVAFEYFVHDVPEDKEGYSTSQFENELGDFLMELVFYGLERDNLGFIDEQNREDYPFQSDTQRGVLS
jgi:hypothetical protein